MTKIFDSLIALLIQLKRANLGKPKDAKPCVPLYDGIGRLPQKIIQARLVAWFFLSKSKSARHERSERIRSTWHFDINAALKR